MFFLTHHERKVLIAIAVLILTGTLLRFLRASAVEAVPALVRESSSEAININSASMQELRKIKGVGEVTARRIVECRQNLGKFKTVEDLKKVKGIGESKAKAISGSICFK